MFSLVDCLCAHRKFKQFDRHKAAYDYRDIIRHDLSCTRKIAITEIIIAVATSIILTLSWVGLLFVVPTGCLGWVFVGGLLLSALSCVPLVVQVPLGTGVVIATIGF